MADLDPAHRHRPPVPPRWAGRRPHVRRRPVQLGDPRGGRPPGARRVGRRAGRVRPARGFRARRRRAGRVDRRDRRATPPVGRGAGGRRVRGPALGRGRLAAAAAGGRVGGDLRRVLRARAARGGRDAARDRRARPGRPGHRGDPGVPPRERRSRSGRRAAPFRDPPAGPSRTVGPQPGGPGAAGARSGPDRRRRGVRPRRGPARARRAAAAPPPDRVRGRGLRWDAPHHRPALQRRRARRGGDRGQRRRAGHRHAPGIAPPRRLRRLSPRAAPRPRSPASRW